VSDNREYTLFSLGGGGSTDMDTKSREQEKGSPKGGGRTSSGAIRVDDHRFDDDKQKAFDLVLQETSWFFCAPSSKHDYLEKQDGGGAAADIHLRNKSGSRGLASPFRSFRRKKKVVSSTTTNFSSSLALPNFVRSKYTIARWRSIVKIACGAGHTAMVSGVLDGHVLYTQGLNQVTTTTMHYHYCCR